MQSVGRRVQFLQIAAERVLPPVSAIEVEDIYLWRAIRRGDLDRVTSLLAQEWPDVPDVNVTNEDGETALTLCVTNATGAPNSFPILKALLAAEGADVNKCNANGNTPLTCSLLAAEKAHAAQNEPQRRRSMRLVKALLKVEGIEVGSEDAGTGRSPFPPNAAPQTGANPRRTLQRHATGYWQHATGRLGSVFRVSASSTRKVNDVQAGDASLSETDSEDEGAAPATITRVDKATQETRTESDSGSGARARRRSRPLKLSRPLPHTMDLRPARPLLTPNAFFWHPNQLSERALHRV